VSHHRGLRATGKGVKIAFLGTGIPPSGGDTKFILISHVIGSYVIGVPAAHLFRVFLASFCVESLRIKSFGGDA
jgi:hypothetical protein